MSGNLPVSLKQKALVLLSLVVWVIASHTCLLAEAGVTFDLSGLSHHAPATETDEGPQNKSGDHCCEELASVWTSGEKFSASSMVSFWNAYEAALDSFRLPHVAVDPTPPNIWPPGGRSFSSLFLGSSLFGRAPPVIG
jgi:hypothetical protein